jgi:hypothetical protein
MTRALDELDVTLDGAAVLDEAHAILTRYVVFPGPQTADAVTLYAAATHAAAELEFATRLVIKSPVKRCGKSRLLDVLAQLVHGPLTTSDISAAALVHSISNDDPPTIMLDEADAIFGKGLKGDEKAEHLRGILNAGFGRDRPYTRWDITTRSVQDCPTFAFAVLAGIGAMPDTIEDRAVIIALRRRAPGEAVAKYRTRRDKPRVTAVGDRLAAWVVPNAKAIGAAVPRMPTGLNDRAEDTWEALLAVADAAGGKWPARARAAALALSADAEDDAADSMRLLADLRDVFGTADALHGETILAKLHEISEAPWGEWFGKPLNARSLAKLLAPYGIRSRDVKITGTTLKGYRREDLWDAWARYLPAERPLSGTPSATSATPVTAQVRAVADEIEEALPPLPLSSEGLLSDQGSDQRGSGGSGSENGNATYLTSEVAEVAEVAEGRPNHATCTVCGEPLDPVLVAGGFTDHGEAA